MIQALPLARAGEQTGPLRVGLTALGCKVNYAEMAELAGRLCALGCEVVPDDEPADVRVLNSCAVTLQADATTRQRLHRLRSRDPDCHLILTGCSVDTNPEGYLARDAEGRPAAAGVDSVFANSDKSLIADHVAGLAAGARITVRSSRPARLRSRAFLKVQDGCNHRCTYCVVWRARGAATSLAAETVAERAGEAAAAGHTEIVLTGVDLGSYGRDLGTDLAALVSHLLETLDSRVRLRLSSINANDITDRLVELNRDPRVCGHWHIPLQSGSDPVLRAMHRGYRRQRYLRVAEALRRRDPATELTTDVMVGFPGETGEDHRATLSLIEAVGFLGCHVFRYSPRPGTHAAQLGERVDDHTARIRSAEARAVAAASGRRRLEKAVGRRLQVVWDHVADGEAHGLSAGYHEVIALPALGTRIGGMQQVEITRRDHDRVRGVVVSGGDGAG